MTTKNVMDEIRSVIPDIDGVNIEPPDHIALQIAVHHRWQIRNTAANVVLQQRLARRRGDKKTSQVLGQQLDKHVQDIAELDRMYPAAKATMEEMDRAPGDSADEEEEG